MKDKFFHFDSFEKVLINENHNIPTVILKNKGKTLVGYEALENTGDLNKVNRNFKLDLGTYDPKNFSKDYKIHKTGDGERVSAVNLMASFFNSVLYETEHYLKINTSPLPKSIMIAEPLPVQIEKEDEENKNWLALYRKNLKKYFESKGFENISFLPEPFAVFQYYKYIKKFRPLFEKKKFVVLVVDFGGGTFDTCVIQTNKDGEISKGVKNSEPLGASSIAKGGSNLDKLILEELLIKYNKGNEADIKKALRFCRDIQKGKKKLEEGSENLIAFYNNYLFALIEVERIKIILSERIRDWDLEKDINESITFSLPADFFEIGSNPQNYLFSSLKFREIFKNFYEGELKKGIRLTLDRAQNSTLDAINYVLLSGGSSLIKWSEKLILRDFKNELKKADFIPLHNYKEIVSSGLAVECARRFYNESGDFADTTYNSINLLLNPNNRGVEFPKYKSKSIEFNSELKEGTLIPSATILREYFNKKLAWRFKLKSPPKNELFYYFLRNSLNIYDNQNSTDEEKYNEELLNIISTKLDVKTKSFDKHIDLTIEIKEDGTVHPEFIFNSLNDKNSIVKCQPFYLDMTFGDAPVPTDTYLGIDFGTSNSSISYVNQKDIEIYDAVKEESINESIKEIVTNGIYPISYTLARYYKETDDEKSLKRYGHLFENILVIILYALINELQSKGKKIAFDINQYMRSAGSILSAIKIFKSQIDKTCLFTIPMLTYFDHKSISLLDKGVQIINETKHTAQNLKSLLDENLSNLLSLYSAFYNNYYFGFFENLASEPFSQDIFGDFVMAHGSGIFTDKLAYQGSNNFAKQYCFLIDHENSKALNLFPFVFWDVCKKHLDSDYGHCYIFSLIRKKDGAIEYTSADGLCKKEILPNQREYKLFLEELQKCSLGNGSTKIYDITLTGKQK